MVIYFPLVIMSQLTGYDIYYVHPSDIHFKCYLFYLLGN